MTKSRTRQKTIAAIFLLLFSVETFLPSVAFAITSGPTTPEMTAFQPASTANMVDLFTGDFSYNIPLLDVGGYPVNLSYNSGAGPDEEASWVGMGWSLNPGAINRQLRGLPDDFKGDVVTQEDKKKENVTVGGNVNVSLKLFGNRLPKIKIGRKKKNLSGNMKVKIGIQHNNYTGYKGMVGIGTGFGTSDDNSDAMTKGLGPASSMDLSASLGLSVDNQSGINPYANFEVNYKTKTKKERQAERDVFIAEKEHQIKTIINGCMMDYIFDTKASEAKVANMQRILNHQSHSGASFGASSAISFNSYQPPAAVQLPMVAKNFTASLSLGVTLFGGTVSPGIEGTYSKQELKSNWNSALAYGFMNSHVAKSKEDALLDYNMEKESPYFKRLPNLGVTVFTPDMYSVTSNAGSMQFRPYLRGAGIFFQPHKHDVDKSVDLGLEPAFGNIFHIGVPLQLNKTNNISGKWTTKNNYNGVGNFKGTDANDARNQAFYFKRVGEKNQQNQDYFNSIGNTNAVSVKLDDNFSSMAFGNGTATMEMRQKGNPNINGGTGQYAKTVRDKANHSISYLTADEAALYAFQPLIPNYDEETICTSPNAVKSWVNRKWLYRKSHHISEFVVTQDDGQRMIYGIPVYNVVQHEVSFAIDHDAQQLQNGVAIYSPGYQNSINNNKGKDHYYHRSITPAYTTGHLLTAILSPDYVDVKNDGVSDDDLGTAVKFNYSQLSDNNGNPRYYKWRTPYSNVNGNINTANYNEGYKSIDDDDKGNYTYGEKELWYLHSIESKTMVAQFYTSDRDDALGAGGENGSKDVNVRQKKLTEIRLYSKSDLYANQNNAVPIKVVHFEYYPNDPIMNNMPNHVSGKGKLTLKRVYFTYGKNTKGQYHSYEFRYNIPPSQNFQENQTDRWGTYRPESANPNGLDNLEFPYATQNKTDADNFASYWQLNEIELPSGAIISVQYESDDYAFVQDRRATQMCFLKGIGQMDVYNTGLSQNFARSNKFYAKLPVATKDDELKYRYFQGLKSLAFRALVDMDGQNVHKEYVNGYAEILSYRLVDANGNPISSGQTSDLVEITVGRLNNDKYNPLSKASWQKLKLDLPRYAYPEYDNLDAEGMGFIKAIKALGATFGRFKDLVESFDARAERKDFGDRVYLNQSWVRLSTPAGIPVGSTRVYGKLGGGHRVKEIRINDQWQQMSGVGTAENGVYGQRYEYTTEASGPQGIESISSGVASYEPMMGNDENPFREPINYVDKQLFGLPKYFYLERPMGESYFPGASVGYSKVTVKNIGADGNIGENGSTVSEFYTSKDFPTKVDELSMERKQPKLNFLPRLFGAKITSGVTVSQGYVVENNDMNGKPKSEAVYGKNGNETTSVKYHYRTKNPNAEKLDLDNVVPVADSNGIIQQDAMVGMDIDMFTEMNESMMQNMGVALDPSFGIALFAIIPKFSVKLPIPKPNFEQRLFRGSTTIKLVNRYAILDKTVKTINGSTSTTQNLLWDSETGEVLLAKVNNEYEQPVYTFNYPAHWKYNGMGAAFQNEGVYLSGLQTNSSGVVSSTGINNFYRKFVLTEGDELIDLKTNRQYWVIVTGTDLNGDDIKALIDKDGSSVTDLNSDIKVRRAGRRNLAIASIGTIVCQNNPIVGNTLDFTQLTKILQAKVIEYDNDWHMPLEETCTSAACWGTIANTNTEPATQAGVSPYLSSTLYNNYAILGTRIYNSGYDAQGYANNFISLNSNYWTNYNYTCSEGPLNRAGVWPNFVNTIGMPAPPPGLPSPEGDTSSFGKPANGMHAEALGNNISTALDNSTIGVNAIPCGQVQATTGRWLGHTFNYTATTSKTLYIGIAGDNEFRFKINGTIVVSRTGSLQNNFRYWNVYPVCVSPGDYTFEFQAYNQDTYGVLGAEVYDNTLTELQNATSDNDLNILFSTRNLVGQNVEVGDGIGYSTVSGYYVYRSGPNQYIGKQSNTIAPGPGGSASLYFNPFRTGVRGNWRVKRELVYDAGRQHNKVVVGDPTGTDIRSSGYFTAFNAYNWDVNALNPKWQWTTETRKFNRKGQEIENQDALNRFSSAQHGYLESVPVAVANNAMHREIGFDGFEDYNFYLGQSNSTDSCGIQDHFSFRKSLGGSAQHDALRSHTGKYSMKLTGSVSMIKPLLNTEPDDIYDIFSEKYRRLNNYLKYGFSPKPSTVNDTRKYVLSGWVYDGQPTSAIINGLTVTICGSNYNVNDFANNPATYSKINVVEGWKRFEIVFAMPTAGNFTLSFAGNNVNLDDIRIHPYDAQLKSFAYDAVSMRLVAELDENNFATFYEYDDEGTLIRVKKETEKGISTIKETRSSVRKK